VGIFNKNRKPENKGSIIKILKPYVDYPIDKGRKKELLKALDRKIGEYTNDKGQLDFQGVIDELYESCFEHKEITTIEYTYLIQVVSLYVYHIVIAGVPIDLKEL